ncbi:MAG: hypothetical protein QOE83_663 [Actinomycetota bacterium]|jgi:hypothetical protein|nr:hypothetical protein [Actinomycetota bacterium]
MRASISRAAAIAVASGVVLLWPSVASAHVEKTVGPVGMEIGFGTEPAYTGQPNSVYLLLTDNGKPVVNLGDSLKVSVSAGGSSVDLPLVPNFELGGDGVPGEYRAYFVPSMPGPYTFHLTGKVGTTAIDETVTSGPKTFDEVQDLSGATFPAIPYPGNGELATRIQADDARTKAALAQANAAVDSARSQASTARMLAIIGIVVGLAGLAVGIAAKRSGRASS